MDYSRLRQEVTTDPLAWGYSSMTDQAAADVLNDPTRGRVRARTEVSSREVLNQIENAAWPTTGINQDKLAAILGAGIIDPSNTNTRGILAALFPNSGQTAATRTRLEALASTPIARGDELSLGGSVVALDVNRARSGVW